MADRTGLFTEPVPGKPPAGTAPIDGRLVLGGLYGTGFSIVSGGAVSQDSGDMGITVGATVWQVPDPSNSGAVFLSPSDPVSVSPAVGPTTGARVDLIEVKQNDYGNGDPDSRVKVQLKAGTVASSPVAPAPDAGFQAAFTVLVPTNATKAAACTVSRVPLVGLGPRPLIAQTLAGLQAVIGVTGQVARVVSDASSVNGDYVWDGSWGRRKPFILAGSVSGKTSPAGAIMVYFPFAPFPGVIPTSVVISEGDMSTAGDANGRLFHGVGWAITDSGFQVRFYRIDTTNWVDVQDVKFQWTAVWL